MMTNLLSSLICNLFQDTFELMNSAPDHGGHGKAMWMGFRLPDQDRALTMALYAPLNYVGVFAALSPAFKDITEIKGWRMASYHSSCWRTDGVEQIISAVQELDATVLDGFGRYIKVEVLPGTVRDEFRRLIQDRDSQQRQTPRATRAFLLGKE